MTIDGPSASAKHPMSTGHPPGRARPPAVEEIVFGLTAPQREAVLHTEGPLQVLAGPGSGKTRVITRRIAYLVSCGVPPWQILALTFTNKAAGEMRERVLTLLSGGDPENRAVRGLTVTTFHSLCARLLRRYAPEEGVVPGLKGDYAIYDSADQLSLMKKVIAALDLSTTNFPPRSVLSRISTAKNDLKDAATFEAEAFDFSSRTIAKIYKAYQAGLRQANAVDFDDLLVLTARMLTDKPAVREECRRRWQYLLIDEYQDTNKAQFVIASLLTGSPAPGKQPNVCVVGDPDQSIYAWRGADISNILDFESQYPGARVIALGENFRSTKSILAAADTLIRNNKRRKHKDLYTARPAGHRVEVVLCGEEHHEAALVVDWFKSLREENVIPANGEPAAAGPPAPLQWKDCAVFYRTNALSRVIEDRLRNEGIPYVIARGTAFYQREEIKNALGYLRVVANPADGVSLARIINTPTRGIGDASFAHAEAFAAANDVPVIEALRSVDEIADISSRSRGAITKFVQMLDSWTGAGSFMGQDVPTSLKDLVERVVRESGLEASYKAGKTETDEDRLENLAELVSSAAEFEQTYDPSTDPALGGPGSSRTEPGDRADPFAAAAAFLEPEMPPLLAILRTYLEQVTLVADADTIDPAQGAVTLMTLHAAKGLEFRAVAMIGLEEGCLPHSRANESEAELEEERRLCFVGITRAMERLVMTSAKYRTVRGISERTIPSRFLDELPREHVLASNQSDSFHDDVTAQSWGGGAGHYGTGGGGAGLGHGAPARRAQGAASSHGLSIGVSVRHPQFGIGRVEAVQSGANARATIKFRDVGVKTLVLEYARLQVIGE
ncbi:MAG: UvrD-helicase domain-containing protein [Phycisphaerales bacterium]|nr:UvrD-helicase domain-containing protein [Phycisphaerales bacterium]